MSRIDIDILLNSSIVPITFKCNVDGCNQYGEAFNKCTKNNCRGTFEYGSGLYRCTTEGCKMMGIFTQKCRNPLCKGWSFVSNIDLLYHTVGV